MGTTVIRFEAVQSNDEGEAVLAVEEHEFADCPEIDLDPIYQILDIGGSPICTILLGWLGDDSLILVGDDEALLKPENKFCTFVRPTDGHMCAGPILVMRQAGDPGSESDYWAPLTGSQVLAVTDALARRGPYAGHGARDKERN